MLERNLIGIVSMTNSNEENLLEQDPPPGHKERIEFLAKALAYGALGDQWSPRFKVIPLNPSRDRVRTGESWEASGDPIYHDRLKEYLRNKWDSQQPQAAFLESFEYLRGVHREGDTIHYMITPKAYALLEQPAIPPKVFISYSRETSSAFALMLEYRLQAEGIPVFIDRSIPSGDDWHAHLQTTVQNCQYFVCLITKAALRSEVVRKEIQWAERRKRIPIWQPGFTSDAEIENYPDWLGEFVEGKQAIRVLEESAEAYHNAVEKLLNALGFALT
jgi:hypothetical protein